MLKAKVNNEIFEIENNKGQILLNKNNVTPDWILIGENKYHAIINNQSLTVELASKDETGKNMIVIINGSKYAVAIENQYDALLKQLGLDKLAGNKVNNIKAPMPGLVLRIMVAVGDSVKKGDSLLVLEAMKMENIIKATGDGIIKKISVNEKTAVEKGSTLIEFE
ncbi:MAG: acetyl-CoA carboxylase biotin carboxyl carrier protein subunit [Bacteroidia bacterium]|nr:acetyl-CoA carboxylase biotin carboxyl carrier protein subunit [Bacteroidia bacterium]MCZ2141010.1 acetyl-CoA carboxylase biotin carboxyl carrier protein subunit [Bacteroidia bacterium]